MERPGTKEIASIKAIKLPTLPGIAMKIIEVMQRESPSIKEIAEMIACDPSLSAKILQTVRLAVLWDYQLKLVGLVWR